MCLALGANALDALDLAVMNGKDRLHIQHSTQKALCAADTPTAMQEFQRIYCEVNSRVFM